MWATGASPSPAPAFRDGMWGAVGHMCIQCVSCCSGVGYLGQEPWCVSGMMSILAVACSMGAGLGCRARKLNAWFAMLVL